MEKKSVLETSIPYGMRGKSIPKTSKPYGMEQCRVGERSIPHGLHYGSVPFTCKPLYFNLKTAQFWQNLRNPVFGQIIDSSKTGLF